MKTEDRKARAYLDMLPKRNRASVKEAFDRYVAAYAGSDGSEGSLPPDALAPWLALQRASSSQAHYLEMTVSLHAALQLFFDEERCEYASSVVTFYRSLVVGELAGLLGRVEELEKRTRR